jgi:hypothetical protein
MKPDSSYFSQIKVRGRSFAFSMLLKKEAFLQDNLMKEGRTTKNSELTRRSRLFYKTEEKGRGRGRRRVEIKKGIEKSS